VYLISLRPSQLRRTVDVTVELDLLLDVKRLQHKSIALVAVELEDYVGDGVGQVVLPLYEDFERTILLSDYLGVDDVVLVPTRPLKLEDFAEVYDIAVGYGKRIYWVFGGPKSPFSNVQQVIELARSVHPRAAYTIVDVVHESSPRKLTSDLVQLGQLVRGLYLSNRSRGSRRRSSLFGSNGVINYAKVAQVAILLDLDVKMVLKHDDVDQYPTDLRILREIVDTTRSTRKFDKDVVKLVEKVYNELFSAYQEAEREE